MASEPACAVNQPDAFPIVAIFSGAFSVSLSVSLISEVRLEMLEDFELF